MRDPWIIAQLAVAGVLAVLSAIGLIGILAIERPELAFSFAGGVQVFGIFPGLTLSLVLNAFLMRRPGPSRALKVMLGIEFGLIALLLLFHFYTDPAGLTFLWALLIWPVVILLAVAIAIVAIVRLSRMRADSLTPEVPTA